MTDEHNNITYIIGRLWTGANNYHITYVLHIYIILMTLTQLHKLNTISEDYPISSLFDL